MYTISYWLLPTRLPIPFKPMLKVCSLTLLLASFKRLSLRRGGGSDLPFYLEKPSIDFDGTNGAFDSPRCKVTFDFLNGKKNTRGCRRAKKQFT